MKSLPGFLSRHVEYSIEGLVGPEDIETFLNSPEFARARTTDQKKVRLAQWLRTRRLEKGYAVPEIDRKFRAFSDKAAAEYESWDRRQAETILRRVGGRSAR